jgi:AmmeMemoRadiSam system protein B
MWAARELGADKVKILKHATSGDITGDYDAVVGYGAAVILKTK